MKKIKDERLQLQNLQNIRIVFLVQNLGIIGILGYDFIYKGMEGMRNNPLWLVFLLSMIISLYLSMSISADYERQPKNPKRSLVISLVGSLLICTLIGFFVAKSESNSILEGVIMGGCLFICILIPVVYIYTLRIKRQEE